MEYKFNFKTEDEKEQLIKDNLNLTLIKIAHHLGESYLVFTDEEIEYELSENEILSKKILVLQEELTQIQTSIASLTSLIVTTLEEK